MLKKIGFLFFSLFCFFPLWLIIFLTAYFLTNFLFAITLISFCLFFVLSLLLWADRLFISSLHLKKMEDDHSFLEQIRTISWRLGIPTPNVFLLEGEYTGIYYLRSYFGNGTIIIGEKLLNFLSIDELYYLNFYSFLRYKENSFRIHQDLTLIFDLLSWPFLGKKYKKDYVFISFFAYLFLPFVKIKNIFLKKILDVKKTKEYSTYFEGKYEYILDCVFFKMKEKGQTKDMGPLFYYLNHHQIIPERSLKLIDEFVS